VTTSDEELRSTPRASRRTWALALAAVAAVGLIAVAWSAASPGDTARWLREAGTVGAIVIAAAYVVTAIAALPIAGVTLLAGGAYGLGGGLAVAIPVELIGALLAFALGRRYLRRRVEARFRGNHRLAAIDRAIGEDGFRIATLVRLSPILPFGAANYALSTTSMRPTTYLAATLVGTLPGTVMYLYLGAMAKDGVEGGAETQIMWWGGLAVTVLALVVVTRAARDALRRAVPHRDGGGCAEVAS